VGSISSPLSALNDALNNMATQMKQRDAGQVQQFQAYVQGKKNEKITDAQYIENLRPDQNRLNLFSAMVQGDNQDYFKLNMNYSGSVHFSMLENLVDDKGNVSPDGATGLDVQIIQMHGDSQTGWPTVIRTPGAPTTPIPSSPATGRTWMRASTW
jgi:hypothetical protein